MKLLYILIFILLMNPAGLAAQNSAETVIKGELNQDTTEQSTTSWSVEVDLYQKYSGPPAISIPEAEIRVYNHHERFFTKKIFIHNSGGSPLIIEDIDPSCDCSRATLQRNPIEPGDSAMVYLQINKDGFYDEKNMVEFLVKSNAPQSVFAIRVWVYEKSEEEINSINPSK